MRGPVIGWRSAKARLQPSFALPAPPGFVLERPEPPPMPLRIGLGLLAIAIYVWGIHSYVIPLGGVVQVALLTGVIIRRQKLRFPAPMMLFTLLAAWSSLGLAVTVDGAVTTKALIDLVKVLVIFFGLINIIRTPAELRFLIIVWLAVYAWYPIRGAIYNQYFCQCTELGRVAWNFVFENPNDLAAFSLVPLGLAGGIAFVERVKIWRWAGIAGTGIVGLVIMLTQSRGVILGMGVGVIALLIASRRKGRDLLLLVITLGIAAVAAPQGVWERLAGLANVSVDEGMKNVDPEGSAESRWAVWQVAYETIREKPLFGVGAGMMPPTHRQIAIRRNMPWIMRGARDTHSTYLRLGAETGIIGVVIFLSIFGAVIARLHRARRLIKYTRPREYQMLLLIEVALIAYLVAGIFGTYGWLSFTYLNLGVAWLAAEILGKHPWYVPPTVAPNQIRR